MKLLFMPKEDKRKKVEKVLNSCGYSPMYLENVSTGVGIQSGLFVEIENTSELLDICKHFTKKEKDEMGLTTLS